MRLPIVKKKLLHLIKTTEDKIIIDALAIVLGCDIVVIENALMQATQIQTPTKNGSMKI